jgi:hypothetical protein
MVMLTELLGLIACCDYTGGDLSLQGDIGAVAARDILESAPRCRDCQRRACRLELVRRASKAEMQRRNSRHRQEAQRSRARD